MTRDGVVPPPRVPASGAERPRAAREGARRVVILGFGHVGRALARRWVVDGHGKADFRWRVVGLVDSHGGVIDDAGVDLEEQLRRKVTEGRVGGRGWGPRGAVEVLESVVPDVVVEVSVSDRPGAEPGSTHVLRALQLGAQVVTSNKGPLALRFPDVEAERRRAAGELRYGTTVGGVVPILRTLAEHLGAAEVTEVRGTLNGTTQFVLGRLREGVPFPLAVQEAQARGLTEADPRGDLDGHDAALKAAILHNTLFAPPISGADVARAALGPQILPRLHEAHARGRTWALVSYVRPGEAGSRWEEVPSGSPWAAGGATSTFEVRTRRGGTLWLQGAGAGPEETVVGLLADLEALSLLAPGVPVRTSAGGGLRAPAPYGVEVGRTTAPRHPVAEAHGLRGPSRSPPPRTPARGHATW